MTGLISGFRLMMAIGARIMVDGRAIAGVLFNGDLLSGILESGRISHGVGNPSCIPAAVCIRPC
jgi:hypothetical protein